MCTKFLVCKKPSAVFRKESFSVAANQDSSQQALPDKVRALVSDHVLNLVNC